MSPRMALLLCIVLAAGCATTRGTLLKDTAAAETTQIESRADENETKEEQPAEPSQKGLEISSHPDEAEVYLDYRFVGETPLLLDDIQPGRYRISLRKRGYYTHEAWIDFQGGYMSYEANLKLITGFFRIAVSPAEAEVTVGARTVPAERVEELAVGTYTVRARAFGYEDYTGTVEISEKSLTELSLGLREAEFRLEALRPSREAFNPRNPGLLGRVRLSFRVTSWGAGRATIRDGQGLEVWSKDLVRFSTWEQGFDWDGRSGSGSLLPDGGYTAAVEALPEGPGPAQRAQVELRIDSSLVLAYRSLWSGASGLLYAPSPDVLPKRSLQAASLLVAAVDPAADPAAIRAPWNLALRFGMGSRNDLELDLAGGAILGNPDAVPLFAGGALKKSLLSPPGSFGLKTALLAKLAWQNMRTDTMANFTGLSLGLPSALVLGRLSLLLSPELVLSPWSVSYTESSFPEPAPTFWAYARAGLILDYSPLTLGFSVTLRSLPFAQGFGLDPPVAAGLEAHWLIPGTQLFLSLAAAGEMRSSASYYFMGGAGLGILN